MSEEKVEWSEDQVIEAFGQFRNSKDSANDKEAEDRLRAFLKSLNKDFFECSDIYYNTY